MKGKVTIQQIADMAGVSKFAVSRALAGKSGVSEATRDMILKTAGQLGYFKSSRMASAQVQPQDFDTATLSGTIVVLFPNIRYQNRDSAYWGPIFDGISERLKEKEIDMITLTEPSSDNVFNLLNPQAIQGIITLGMVSTQILLDIKRLGIPIVMVDHVDSAFHADLVCNDNFTSMRDLMVKLIGKGYKRFQFVGEVQYAYSYYERWLAFRAALEEFGLQQEQDRRLIGPEAAEMHKVLQVVLDDELPEVFVCVNDITAVHLMEVCRDKGISIPEQVKVTGFDNTHETTPRLTTVHVDKELLGRRAVDKMIWRSNNRGSQPEKTMIYAELLLREST